MKKWYNEYKSPIRIHDYFTIMIDQFPIIAIRKYDWPHEGSGYNFIIAIMGISIFNRKRE